MDYKEIVNSVDKYHFYLVVKKKAGLLGSSNNACNALDEAIENLKPKYNGLLVVKLTIKRVSKRLLQSNKESKLKLIKGKIYFKIEFYKIENGDIVKLEDYPKNNKIYITDKFLKHNELSDKILKRIVSSAHNNKLSTKLFDINTIDRIM